MFVVVFCPIAKVVVFAEQIIIDWSMICFVEPIIIVPARRWVCVVRGSRIGETETIRLFVSVCCFLSNGWLVRWFVCCFFSRSLLVVWMFWVCFVLSVTVGRTLCAECCWHFNERKHPKVNYSPCFPINRTCWYNLKLQSLKARNCWKYWWFVFVLLVSCQAGDQRCNDKRVFVCVLLVFLLLLRYWLIERNGSMFFVFVVSAMKWILLCVMFLFFQIRENTSSSVRQSNVIGVVEDENGG